MLLFPVFRDLLLRNPRLIATDWEGSQLSGAEQSVLLAIAYTMQYAYKLNIFSGHDNCRTEYYDKVITFMIDKGFDPTFEIKNPNDKALYLDVFVHQEYQTITNITRLFTSGNSIDHAVKSLRCGNIDVVHQTPCTYLHYSSKSKISGIEQIQE